MPLLAYRRIKFKQLARHEARWAYIFISPWVIGLLLFTLGPMLASLFLSFTEYNELTDARWVGLQNYGAMFGADHVNVSKSFLNAFYLAAIGVPLGILTGLSVALLLNTNVRGLRWYRTIFYLPAIVPTIPSALLWSWVLAADPNRGLVNSVWQQTISKWLSLPPPGWLQSEAWSKPALIAMGLWGAGSGMILWLAGLKGISRSLYEASEIDGATARQQFTSITWPQLSPIIFFNVVIGFIGALQEFDRVYVMKPNDESVGPGDSMLVPVFYLFRNAFGNPKKHSISPAKSMPLSQRDRPSHPFHKSLCRSAQRPHNIPRSPSPNLPVSPSLRLSISQSLRLFPHIPSSSHARRIDRSAGHPLHGRSESAARRPRI